MLNIEYLGYEVDRKEKNRIEAILTGIYLKTKDVKKLKAVINRRNDSFEGHFELDAKNLSHSEIANDPTVEGLLYHLLARVNILLDDGEDLLMEST